MTHVEHLKSLGVCKFGLEFASQYNSAQETWDAAIAERHPDWLIWWVCHIHGWVSVETVVRRAVLRSVSYAADACEKAGLSEHAAKLRAIKSDAPFAEIRDAARDAARAARASTWAAYCADAAHYAYYAADAAAADAADNASYAAAASRADAAPARDREIDAQLSDIRKLLTCPWKEETS